MQVEQTDLNNELNDKAVVGFLTRNPEFFVNNQDILPRLRIPHESGKAVSLIEKQVSVLRGKCGTLENSLRDLISVARENENLHQRLHVLIQDIISAPKLGDIVKLTRSSLCENFNADDVHLLLVANNPAAKSTKKKAASSATKTAAKPATRQRKARAIEGLSVVSADNENLALFTELFESGETLCGLPSAEQIECFVGQDYANIASAAMIPLFHEDKLGVVMLTSRDESRFATGKGVMFLNQLGELLSRRLHSYGAIAPSLIK